MPLEVFFIISLFPPVSRWKHVLSHLLGIFSKFETTRRATLALLVHWDYCVSIRTTGGFSVTEELLQGEGRREGGKESERASITSVGLRLLQVKQSKQQVSWSRTCLSYARGPQRTSSPDRHAASPEMAASSEMFCAWHDELIVVGYRPTRFILRGCSSSQILSPVHLKSLHFAASN